MAIHINFDGVADTKEQGAGVFHSPLNIGNNKVRLDLDLIARGMGLHGHSHFMAGAVNGEQAVDHGCGQRTFDAVWTEDDLGILGTLQNVLVHPFVSRFAAARAALRVNDHFPRALAGLQIVIDGSAFELKGAMDGVKDVIQCELHLGLGWIQFEHCFLA